MISKDDLNSLCNVDYFEDRFLADTLITVRKNYIYKLAYNNENDDIETIINNICNDLEIEKLEEK